MNEFSTFLLWTEFPPDSSAQLLWGPWRLNKYEVFHPMDSSKDLKRCALHSGSVYHHRTWIPKHPRPLPPYARYFFISTTGSTAQLVTGCMISMVSANQIIMRRQTQPQTSSECENNLIEGIQGCTYVKCNFPLCCWTAQCHVWLWWDQQVAMTTGTQVENQHKGYVGSICYLDQMTLWFSVHIISWCKTRIYCTCSCVKTVL